jgi:hypothetical protein
VIDLAVDLTQRHRLRGYDAVQRATALVANRHLVGQGVRSWCSCTSGTG